MYYFKQNTKYKRSIRLLLFFFIVTTFISCLKKEINKPVLSKNDLIGKIYKNNHYICSLRRKGVFYIENRFNKIKFKGYIYKECDNNFILNILGLFNNVEYKAVFKNGVFDLLKKNKSVKNEFSSLLNDNQIAKISSSLNIPLALLEKTLLLLI